MNRKIANKNEIKRITNNCIAWVWLVLPYIGLLSYSKATEVQEIQLGTIAPMSSVDHQLRWYPLYFGLLWEVLELELRRQTYSFSMTYVIVDSDKGGISYES